MSKIRLSQNKEILVAISLIAGLLILMIINMAVLIPGINSVYLPGAKQANSDPIDTLTVNEAIKLLNGKQF
jgi:hypothetical protein